MLKVRLIIAALLVAVSFGSFAQMPTKSTNPKLIAVVNRANWCGVCNVHAERFTKVLMPYTEKGINVYLNDLTNLESKEVSKQELEKVQIYESVNSIPRKGLGKAFKACGMIHDKKQTKDVAGIVSFIDPKSHKLLKQVSISIPDQEMKKCIDQLLN